MVLWGPWNSTNYVLADICNVLWGTIECHPQNNFLMVLLVMDSMCSVRQH